MKADGRCGKQTNQLITGCQGLVRSIAWKIHQQLPPHVELDDLIGYGQIGLAEAARDYEPERRTEFTTFAYYRIRGAILDGLSRLAWFNRAEYHQGRYECFAHEVLQPEPGAAGRSSNSALYDDVAWVKEATGTLAVVYLMSSGSRIAADPSGIEAPQSSPDAAAIQQEMCGKLRSLVDQLPSDARALIQKAYFEGLSLKEAGEQIGISKAWASRLHAKSLQQLARKLSREMN
jgi:RNA polymerase sigma factor for flagellar operon FliA